LILRLNVLVTFDMNGRWHCSGNNTTEVIRVHSLTRSPLVNFIFFEIPNLDDWNHLDGNPGFFYDSQWENHQPGTSTFVGTAVLQ
jgi:hypothetical protein